MNGLTLRQRLGLNFPPLLLRLVLGVIFLWAGLGKVSTSFVPTPAEAEILAAMGVLPAPAPASPPANPPPATRPAEGSPSDTNWQLVAQRAEPGQAKVLGLHRLSMLIYRSANPPATEAGTPGMALWPPRLAQKSAPVWFAWAAAVTELLGGALLLLGLFTRFWGLALAGVMVVAIWLTEVGPAIQKGQTVLGFLPDYPTFGVAEWQRLMFQACCLVMALSLAALGSGRLGLDRLLARKGPDEDLD